MHILAAGARVLTLDGTLPVEYLMAGDRIITRDSGAVTLISRRRIEERVNCIWLAQDSIGPRRPTRRCMMPAQTVLYLRGETPARAAPVAMMPAGRLLNGVTVRYAGRPMVSLIELRFDAPHILYVDGLEVAPITAQTQATAPVAEPLASPLQ